MTEPPEQFLKRLQQDKISRVPGTAVFLTRLADGTPPLMIEHVAQIGALHRNLIALTVKFEDVPRERSANRLKMVKVSDNFWHVTVRYGFVEVPDLPVALREAKVSPAISISIRLFTSLRAMKQSIARPGQH